MGRVALGRLVAEEAEARHKRLLAAWAAIEDAVAVAVEDAFGGQVEVADQAEEQEGPVHHRLAQAGCHSGAGELVARHTLGQRCACRQKTKR